MDFEIARKKYIVKRSHFVIYAINNGKVIDQTESQLYKHIDNIYETFPLLESIKTSLDLIDQNEDLYYPCIEVLPLPKRFFDLHISVIDRDKAFLVIEDLTKHYRHLRTYQQERNESAIYSELVQLQKKNIELEKKLLEKENKDLLDKQKFKTDLYNKLSHDIRTPVNGIIGLAELLSNKELSKDLVTKYSKALKNTGEYLTSIVNSLLDLASLESGFFRVKNVEFDLHEALNAIINSFAFKAEEKGLKLNLQISNDVPEKVNGDFLRFSQIAYNLLSNAFKYTHEGFIEIKVALSSDEKIRFDFCDSGIGMNHEDLASVKNAFQQVKNKENNFDQGFGLGLSIVQQLTQALEGTFTIDSSLGKGSVMRVELPFVYNEKFVQNKETNSASDLKGQQILVLEDDTLNLLYIKEILKRTGAKIYGVELLASALELCENHKFEIIVSDYHLGNDSASEFLIKIRQKQPKARIFISSGEANIDLLSFADVKVEASIKKPYNSVELLECILNYDKIEDHLIESSGSDLSEIINFQQLRQSSEGDVEMAKTLYSSFAEYIYEELEKLTDAIRSGDSATVSNLVHKLTPAFYYLGLTNLSTQLGELSVENKKSTAVLNELKDSCKKAINYVLNGQLTTF